MPQRAYTARLRLNSEQREALWNTHSTVNRGARAFGDILLTLRGGLPASWAASVQGTADVPQEPLNPEIIRWRRRLISLCWLTVEDTRHAPERFCVSASDLKLTLHKILALENVALGDREQWCLDCEPALDARIREDGTWVNRHAAFREFAVTVTQTDGGRGFDGAAGWDMLKHFFSDPESFLSKPETAAHESTGQAFSDEPAPMVQTAGHFLSARFGTGEGSDYEGLIKVYSDIAGWDPGTLEGRPGSDALPSLAAVLRASPTVDAVLKKVTARGRPSATRVRLENLLSAKAVKADQIDGVLKAARENLVVAREKTGASGKGARAYANEVLRIVQSECRLTYDCPNGGTSRHKFFSVMLDHAARRVSSCHSWVKNAEASRERYVEDARMLVELVAEHPRAVAWLDDYCDRRSEETGSIDEDYRIRRRALGGWPSVVARWLRDDCVTEAQRITAARELQDTEEKFGDIQLFEALAAESAAVVWRGPEGGPEVLRLYVAARDAEAQSTRRKVPLYCHPDELAHPVYVDFGDSRPTVIFEAAKRMQEIDSLDRKLANLPAQGGGTPQEERKRATLASKRACLLDESGAVCRKAQLDVAFAGNQTGSIRVDWSGHRLAADLGIDIDPAAVGTVSDAPRSSRLGRAAANVPADVPVAPLVALKKEHWNARLQAPREQLDSIDRARRRGRAVDGAISEITWFISTSPELPDNIGPWKRLLETAPTHPNDRTPHAAANKRRGGRARLQLSRIPGLRVLGVDLGLRHAAACTVWRQLNSKEVRELCQAAGRPLPASTDLSVCFSRRDGRAGRVVLRRVGGDTLESGELSNPAPWALLERQFLIKLPGEDDPPRAAALAEVVSVRERLTQLGRVDAASVDLPRDVRALMSESVLGAQRGLRLTGDLARAVVGLGSAADAAAIATALDHLFRVAGGDRWRSVEAAASWILHLGAMPVSQSTDRSRKRREDDLRVLLQPATERLLNDAALRTALIEDLRSAWRAQSDRTQSALRWLRRWLMPRVDRRGFTDRLSQEEQTVHLSRLGAARHLGGLSLARLALLESLWRAQKAFAMRPSPDNLRANVPDRGDHGLDRFGIRLRETFEQLRENRVKQLASRLAEAALGLGARPERDKGGRLGPRAVVPCHPACHAIVIERLDHYRPDETRLRRENRGLQQWAAGQLEKHITDQCELHGLELRKVSPSYTSRQDARTGAPGLRCVDVPVADFVAENGFWARRRDAAEGEELSLLRELFGASRWRPLLRSWTDRWGDWTLSPNGDWRLARRSGYCPEKRPTTPMALRLPQRGGDLFVSVADDSPCSQADLNASANIALRALLDPDWPGTWWRLLAEPGDGPNTYLVSPEDIKGSAATAHLRILSSAGALSAVRNGGRPGRGSGRPEASVRYNLWRDPSGSPLPESGWQLYADYQRSVVQRVCLRLRRHNSAEPGVAPELA